MNPRLKAASADLLAQAEKQFEETGMKQRLFLPLMYQADSWGQPRQVVIKCEAPVQGTNRRAVSTNRPGWLVNPTAVYDEYTGPPKRRCAVRARTASRNSNANWRPIA